MPQPDWGSPVALFGASFAVERVSDSTVDRCRRFIAAVKRFQPAPRTVSRTGADMTKSTVALEYTGQKCFVRGKMNKVSLSG
jgi:hypothetical protein